MTEKGEQYKLTANEMDQQFSSYGSSRFLVYRLAHSFAA